MKIKVKRYEIIDSKISKELSGYRIALFSDTHNKFYGEKAELITDILQKEKPDVVLFAGDAIKKSSKNRKPYCGFDRALNVFSNVAKDFDTYFVCGNHERRWKKQCKGLTLFSDFIKDLGRAGVHVLCNGSARLAGGRIHLTGLDLPLKYYRHFTKYTGNLSRFIGQPEKDAYNILLAHTPAFFEDYASWGADLCLCGHIHGGIVRLPVFGGLLSPHRRFFPKYDYGYFELGSAKMIVSSGAGDHNPRIVFNNPYELVIISLRSPAA